MNLSFIDRKIKIISLDYNQIISFDIKKKLAITGNLKLIKAIIKFLGPFKNGFNLNQEVGPNYLYGLLDNPARVAIHYSHRISALFVTLIFLILMSRLWFSDAAPLASTLGILLLTQITLGIINVVYVLPLYVAIAHNLVAACLLLAMFTVNYLAWKK